MAVVHQDETRHYRDAENVVHRSSDLGQGNRITFCERYDLGMDVYDTRELQLTDAPLTCLRCLWLPQTLWPGAA
jgi:hypothetical protein